MSDQEQPYVRKVDRRTALIWVGAVGVAAAAAGGGAYVFRDKLPWEKGGKGYGTDPNLVKPAAAPWPRLMSDDELTCCARIADFILPASAGAPAASALGIPDFLDEWVSAPYPNQLEDRKIIRGGLKGLIKEIVHGDGPTRQVTLDELPHAEDEETRKFFKRFRALTIGAYYTTQAGFKDIGYIGNVSRASDPGPSPEVIAVLEQRLQALGL